MHGKQKILISLIALTLSLPLMGGGRGERLSFSSGGDTESFGFAAGVTGGGCWSVPLKEGADVAVVVSDGGDMREKIMTAVKRHDIVVLDGSRGEFTISKAMPLSGLRDKTIMGINNATLCTQWQVTTEIKSMMDAAGVKNMSGASGGGTLANGAVVAEEGEYHTRRILLEKYGKEDYRQAGVFTVSRCENIIIRNISFRGPGSIDVGGSDLISLLHSTGVWVDHCTFVDGIDGNLDITQSSDRVTVSWCSFSYTDRSYAHQYTNLIGSSEEEPEGFLNTTLAYNHWGAMCHARMPMARIGVIHVMNNTYECAGAGQTINPNYRSQVLIQGNWFGKGVKKLLLDRNSTAYQWDEDNYVSEAVAKPVSKGTVSVPYEYTVGDAQQTAVEVRNASGATLWTGITMEPTTEEGSPEGDITIRGNTYVLLGSEAAPSDGKRIVCTDITMTYGNDGAWQDPHAAESVPESYVCYVAGQQNPVDAAGKAYSAKNANVPVKGTYYVFTPQNDGELSVAVSIYKNKALYVTEDGKAQSMTVNGRECASGSVIDPEKQVAAIVTFTVKAGRKYHVFCNYSKMGFCGFSFVPQRQTGIVAPTKEKERKGKYVRVWPFVADPMYDEGIKPFSEYKRIKR